MGRSVASRDFFATFNLMMTSSHLRVDRCGFASGLLRFAPALPLAAALLAAGCASPSASNSANAAPEAAPASSPAAPELKKGMTAAELKAVLGEPKEVRPFVVNDVASEVWVFERRVPGKTRQVVARMREVPYVDPITGVMRMIQEPVHENETTTLIEVTEVLMFSGVVAEWKRALDAERAFN